MKKIIFAFAAALMMSMNVAAQDDQNQQRGERRQLTKEQMIKQRTDQMVKEYGLDATQAEALNKLNTEYADKLPMMGRGGRGGRPGGRPNRDGQQVRPENNGDRQQARPQMSMEDMRKNMEAYEAGLKKIMSEDQYKTYQENRQKRMRQGFGGGRRGEGQGQRPQRPANNE